MMDVKKITSLARLKITKEEGEMLEEQISKFFKYVEKISKIDTENIKPLLSTLERETLFHLDEIDNSFSADLALKNAPDISQPRPFAGQ